MPLPQLPIAWQMVIKTFRPTPFTAILKALHFNKSHTVEIIKNMRKYFHMGSTKMGKYGKPNSFRYIIKNILIFFQQNTFLKNKC
jgi:hypothetical protein